MNTSWSGSDPYYRWDETRTPAGAHRCSSSAQCDGMRTCSQFGWCQGSARPETPPQPINDNAKPGWVPPDQVQQPNRPGWDPPPPPQPVNPPPQPPRPIPQPGWTPPPPPPPRPSHRDWNPPQPRPRPPVQKDEYYHWDEMRNSGGPHRCSSSLQCDGMRTCSEFGWCQGTARPEPERKGRHYRWDERNNPLGPNRCRTSYECDGERVCTASGYCAGRAR
jgi:hypothetical protein